MSDLSTPPQSVFARDRQQSMQAAYNAYIGKPSKPLRVTPGQPDDNVIVSLGRLIVDKGVSFLFGEPVQSQIVTAKGATDAATTGAAAARQDWLDECWRRNKRALRLAQMATNGGIFGHCFVRLVAADQFPRLVVLDPQTVDVMTDSDDIEHVWQFTITPPPYQPGDDGAQQSGGTGQGQGQDPRVHHRTVVTTPDGQAGYRTDAPERWMIVDQEYRGGAWQTTAQADWPFPFCPIVHCQNLPKPNDFWGESDLPDDLQQMLQALNRVTSHYNKIIRLHAHPKVWSRGMGTRTLDVAIDSVINLPSETAELRALEMQSDLGSTMALIEKLLSLISMAARIPLVAMGMPDNLGAISGVALQIRYQPLIEKTNSKRNTYGDMLTEIDRRLLAMDRFGDTTITQLVWPELLPSDPLMERQTWVLDDSLGLVSKETLSERAGYDFDEEQKRIAAQRQANVAAGLNPDGSVPAPAPIQAPEPDVAKTGKSR